MKYQPGLRVAWVVPLLALAVLPFSTHSAQAADVTLDLKIEHKPVILFQGNPRPAHELIREMSRRTVGQTESSVRTTTRVLYRFVAERDPDGRYRINASNLALAQSARLSARIVIRYPKLSEAQYKALRGTRDYRLVYGLIRGIVEHEEEHAKEFIRFAKAVRGTYASPPISENPVVALNEGETASTALLRYINDRIQEALNDAKRASDAVQRSIDHTGKTTRVTFRFTDPVKDIVPPLMVYQTEGKLRVKFEVPKGSPRPLEPRTKR